MASPVSTKSFSRNTLSAAIAPYRRRPATADTARAPLLTLACSSMSFLDSELVDTATRTPVYTITTVGTSTSIAHSFPREGVADVAAEVKWPKRVAAAKHKRTGSAATLVHMPGRRWSESDYFLSSSSMSSSRKFFIPNYSHPLKWKRAGSTYHLSTPAVKGSIASLEPSSESATACLKIFETFRDRYDPRSLAVHSGVSIFLLDYILVTAMLLVTDAQEWMLVPKYDPRVNGPSTVTLPASLQTSLQDDDDRQTYDPRAASTSELQWRKIVYREPLYHKASTLSRSSSRFTNDPDDDSSLNYSTRPPSPAETAMPAGNHTGVRLPRRPSSPSAESLFYPLTTSSSAPAHTYLDPSFYHGGSDVPPVPPMPLQYRSASSSSSSSPTSPLAPNSGSTIRAQPPPTQWDRAHSTPPRSSNASPSPVSAPSPSASAPPSRQPSQIYTGGPPASQPASPARASLYASGSLRRLPQPPAVSPLADAPAAAADAQRAKRASTFFPRSLPPTPGPGPSTTAPQLSLAPPPPPPLPTATPHSAPLPQPLPAPAPSASPGGAHALQKEVDELAHWMRALAPARPVFDVDVPPPAYNSINFSRPARARAGAGAGVGPAVVVAGPAVVVAGPAEEQGLGRGHAAGASLPSPPATPVQAKF